jgi:hypothetical protein
MARRALSASGELTEAAFQAQVVGLARMYGWRPYHAPDGGAPQRNGRRVVGGQLPEGRGFPDLLLLRGPELVVAELKTRTGRIGPGQREWLDAWTELGAHVARGLDELKLLGTNDYVPSVRAYLWRPSDWEQIQRVLGRGHERRVELDPIPQRP